MNGLKKNYIVLMGKKFGRSCRNWKSLKRLAAKRTFIAELRIYTVNLVFSCTINLYIYLSCSTLQTLQNVLHIGHLVLHTWKVYRTSKICTQQYSIIYKKTWQISFKVWHLVKKGHNFLYFDENLPDIRTERLIISTRLA